MPGLVVYRYDSPLFFANAEDFRRRALAAVDDQREPVAWFVLNTEANVEVDSTGLDAVEELRAELTGRGVVFALARVKQDLRDDLDAYGLTAADRRRTGSSRPCPPPSPRTGTGAGPTQIRGDPRPAVRPRRQCECSPSRRVASTAAWVRRSRPSLASRLET